MPTNRTRRRHGRRDTLSLAMKEHLRFGCYLIWHEPGDEFRSEDERRAMWRAYRNLILDEWDRPGARPDGFWSYDMPDGWAAVGESQSDAVWRLVSAGRIEPLTPDELARIERDWHEAIRIAMLHTTSPAAAREYAGWAHAGVPRWFFDRHVKRVRGERSEGDDAA